MARLIDSSVFIAMERQGRAPQDLAIAWADEPVALAAVTASELLVGVHRADSRARRLTREDFVEGIIQLFPVLPFDLRVARIHAEIWAKLTSTGSTIGSVDMIIASTALAYGYSILTNNVREFHRLPGLDLAERRALLNGLDAVVLVEVGGGNAAGAPRLARLAPYLRE